MYGGCDSSKALIVALIVVLIIALVFSPQLKALMKSKSSANEGQDFVVPDEDNIAKEHLENDNQLGMGITDGTINPESSELMQIMGYADGTSWDETLKATELDPGTYSNHQNFVKDVRRFSSGANFTSVTDDNTNSAFTNFVGLRRPMGVAIGASARQQPDIDQSVLKRNQPLRWGMAAGDGTYLTAEQVGVPAGQYQYRYESDVQNAENFVNW